MKQQLSRRLLQILETILNYDFADKDELLQTFSISKRTLYYDLSKLNNALLEMNLGMIQSGAIGFFIEKKNKDKIRDTFNLAYKGNYINRNHERLHIILIHLLKNDSILTIEKLEELLSVSRNTVVNDLKNVRGFLDDFDLILESQNGYVITGSEINRRALFSHVFNDYNYLFDSIDLDPQLLKLFDQVIDNEYNARYLTTFYRGFYHGVPINTSSINMYIRDCDVAVTAKEKLQCLTDTVICKDEIAFVSLMILDNLEIRSTFINVEPKKYEQWNQIVMCIIKEFERLSCIFIEQKVDLANKIIHHLIPFIVKSRLGIYYCNVIKDSIKSKYSVIYSLTRRAVLAYKDQFDGFLFNDDMLSYIVLYFGALLHDTSDFNRKPKLLIACNKGYATSQLLALQIAELFPNSEIVGVVRSAEICRYAGHYDFVITNEKEYSGENIINVESILTEYDKNELLFRISNLQINIRSKQVVVNHIIEKIEENAIIQNKPKLLSDIEFVLNNIDLKNNKFMPALTQIISMDVVQFEINECNWKQAIQLGSMPLLANNSINNSYVEDMISTVERIGPYFIIGDEFALAHASPDAGVNRLAISVTVFKNPVHVSDRQFRVLLILTPIDKKSHINIIADINQIIADDDKYAKIKGVQSKEELYELLKKRS
ncbi:MAG: PTS sugar transporter subunit IIA [Erysipelotrichaceae bacterium]|nr:PTS sugar transporter subunit IIA [Erysipelotrichaceae bacterium]MDP3305832.1 PTS sugar transporter subunit IIA [Erysipelotrichaceae bacterium]